MLSYQHGYHAGNFADVIKHLTLSRIISYLILKDKPIFYLETHSGKGLYDFNNHQAEKTGEYKQGINLIWPDRNILPEELSGYMQLISRLNPNKTLRYYPGSPTIAISGLRQQDRLFLCELHPTEYKELINTPTIHKKVHFSHSDGIANLKALLPPPEKRGLIFIDPSYEIKEEYQQIPAALLQAYLRFSTGVYCLWYPVVNRRATDQLISRLKAINANSALNIELNLPPSQKEGMTGCGLWIINPPYTLENEMRVILSVLKTYFCLENSGCIIKSYS